MEKVKDILFIILGFAITIAILLFIIKISSEKQMFLLNKISPIFLIAKVIIDNKSKICSIKKKEKFIIVPKITALKTNWIGDSTWLKVKWENKYLTA